MIIGILSDTHDRLDATRAAIEILRQRGAEFYIHCGDVGCESILDELAGLPSAFVFGNNDWDLKGLTRYAQQLDIICLGAAGELLNLEDKSFYVCHGDDFHAMRAALDAQKYDYLLHGHSHVRRDEKFGRTRIINPGALHRAREKTVALLDTTTDQLTFMTVNA